MLDGQPFRIAFTPYTDLHDSLLAGHLEAAKEYPRATRGKHLHPVAVVGGGPSLLGRLDELRGWPGDIWAINSTCDWLKERGIDSTLYTVDHSHIQSKASRALLASCCHPEMFKGREVRVFDMAEHAEGGIVGGTTSAARAPALALLLGYPGAVFFGCDSSFEDADHVDRHENLPEMVMVRANGRDYKTRPDLLLQAQSLSQLIRTFDAFFIDKSAGLLSAMVADEGWSIVGVSAAMKDKLIEANGDQGIYDAPYVPPCGECGRVHGHYDDCPAGIEGRGL